MKPLIILKKIKYVKLICIIGEEALISHLSKTDFCLPSIEFLWEYLSECGTRYSTTTKFVVWGWSSRFLDNKHALLPPGEGGPELFGSIIGLSDEEVAAEASRLLTSRAEAGDADADRPPDLLAFEAEVSPRDHGCARLCA